MTKKYRAYTKEEALKMASEELGKDAIVLNIKKVTPKGIFSTFRKPYVEVLAVNNKENTESNLSFNNLSNLESKENAEEKDEYIKSLENQLKQVTETFKQAMFSFNNKSNFKNSFVNFIYDLLKNQQVCDEICFEILSEFDDLSTSGQNNIDFIIKGVYNKIFEILENAKATSILSTSKKENRKILFVGNTGVGKTTTIAKISSNIIMENSSKVAFITLDTYRIAATEQLKVYADILGCDVKVIYDVKDLEETVSSLSLINDFIFFDTAGRSHNNLENIKEIEEFVRAVPDSENYLVLSACAKFEDILNIINTYDKFMEFNIILTKLDETNFLGNVLNIAKYTNKKIAYVTNGQNVPTDIEEFSPVQISKKILESIYK